MSCDKKFPFADLSDVTRPIRDEILAALTRVVDSGRYIGGSECDRFEEKLASITGTKFCVGVSNGLDALRLIFRAYIIMGQLRPGDEVIVPANTYIASVLAVTQMGLKPVFVEPDRHTLNLDWTKIEENMGERTRAVLTVHLYGRISWNAEIAARLKAKGILFIEDNAQAIGAVTTEGLHSGALGDAAAFSFYPTKNIGALGDAGAVTTDDEKLAHTVRALANYGSDKRYHNIFEGYNCRLDPLQAAVLSVKLDSLDRENERRRTIADIYSTTIHNPLLTLPFPGTSDMVWHQYVVQVEDRDRFTRFLDSHGIGWDIHYPVPPHRQPCYSDIYGNLHLPITDNISATAVSLPISPSTTTRDAQEIASALNSYK